MELRTLGSELEVVEKLGRLSAFVAVLSSLCLVETFNELKLNKGQLWGYLVKLVSMRIVLEARQ
jgi:hypothetical protein